MKHGLDGIMIGLLLFRLCMITTFNVDHPSYLECPFALLMAGLAVCHVYCHAYVHTCHPNYASS